MNKRIFVVAAISLFIGLSAYFSSCSKGRLKRVKNNIEFPARLSDWNIFSGQMSDLVPANGYVIFELSTQLFTDYAEKQRLVKIPVGTEIKAEGDGILNFPDNTILVKTFYYYHDKRDTAKGKRIIETRLLVKSKGQWNAVTYIWNKEQTEGNLISAGFNVTVNWIDDHGFGNVISYHIPSGNECATCHNSNNELIPLGPKVRNLNFSVLRNNTIINQLQYLKNEGLLDIADPAAHTSLPDWKNTSFTLEQRARAYLDVNCAHCHNENGFAGKASKLRLSYEVPLDDTHIKKRKEAIPLLIEKKVMPMLGTTMVDREALEVIRAYINNLR